MTRAGVFLLVFSFLLSCSSNSEKNNGVNDLPEDYSQVGAASWYGPGFHGEKTASGELFDMYACTAAHRSLPMGAMVRVSNLENGREVIVKVNDRGPYAGGRIIDLSRAAAKSVGITGENGIAEVRIKVVSSFLKNYLRVKPISLTILAGVLGTGGMGLFIWLVNRSGFINTDIIRAVGSVYTGSYYNSLLPGLFILSSAGITVALLFVAFLSPFLSCSIASSIGMGALTGLLCGLALSLLLVVVFSRHHPIEQFRDSRFEVALIYLVGFFLYGIIMGAVTGVTYVMFF